MVYEKEKHRFGNVTQCVVGKKIKGREGKIIKGYGIIYTPVKMFMVKRSLKIGLISPY